MEWMIGRVGRKVMLVSCLAMSLLAVLSCDRDETAFSTQDASGFKSTLAGRVQDQSGTALRGALVTTAPGGATTVTGDSGKFEFTLAAGSYRVEVSKDDYRDTSWADSVRLGLLAQKTLESPLHAQYRYATVVGNVYDADGTGTPGAGVAVEDQSISATSYSSGKFTLARVEPGSIRLFAIISGQGYATLDTVLHPGDTLRNIPLKISRKGGTVTGTILTSGGAAVSGATVSAAGGVVSTTTATDGSFTLSTVPSTGSVVLTVSSTGSTGDSSTQKISGVTASEGAVSSVGSIQVASKAASSVDSVVARSGIALGYVGDSVASLLGDTTGRDTTFHIYRWLWSGSGLVDSSSASSYKLHIARLQWGEGTYSVAVRAKAIDGRLSGTGTVNVRIMDTSTALSGLKVGSGKLTPLLSSGVSSYVDTVDASATKLAITPIASSSDTIWVNGGLTASGVASSVSVSADTTIPIVVKNRYTLASRSYTISVVHKDTTTARATVAGRVLDQSGNVLKGAVVTASPGGAAVTTADSGKFSMTLVSGRSYRLSVSKDDYRDTSWNDSVSLTGTAGRTLDALMMKYRYATIRGIVRDSTGTTAIGAGVAVQDQSISSLSLSGGAFQLSRVEPGRVRLFAVVSGQGCASLDTVLNASDTLKGVSLKISRKGGTVTGRVLSSGGFAMSGAKVTTVGGAVTATTASDGSFALSTVPSTGSVVLSISASTGDTQKVSGVTAVEGSTSSVGSIQLGVLSTSDPPVARPGAAFGYLGDTAVVLLGDTAGSDTSFHVHRWLWSASGISDSSNAATYKLHFAKLGWSTGDHVVSVQARALDGRLSGVGALTVRILDTSTALYSLKVGSGTLSPSFNSSVSSYVDTVASATTSLVLTPTTSSSSDTIAIGGSVVASGSSRTITFNADTVVSIVVRNAYTLIGRTYSISVVRKVAKALDTGSFVDARDSSNYGWVKIGTQTWMRQNLNYDTLNDSGSWCYDGSAANCATYGRLYTWATAMGLNSGCSSASCSTQVDASTSWRGACPSGWHVPTDTEWGALIAAVGADSARIRLSSQNGWSLGAGTDDYGFAVLPGGYISGSAGIGLGNQAFFWSTVEKSAAGAWSRSLYYTDLAVKRGNNLKTNGFSLRCVEDD